MYMAYVKSKRMGSKKRKARKTRRIKGGGNQEGAGNTPMEINVEEKTKIETGPSLSAEATQAEVSATNPTIDKAISMLGEVTELLKKMTP